MSGMKWMGGILAVSLVLVSAPSFAAEKEHGGKEHGGTSTATPSGTTEGPGAPSGATTAAPFPGMEQLAPPAVRRLRPCASIPPGRDRGDPAESSLRKDRNAGTEESPSANQESPHGLLKKPRAGKGDPNPFRLQAVLPGWSVQVTSRPQAPRRR